jgi:hypothetical protein
MTTGRINQVTIVKLIQITEVKYPKASDNVFRVSLNK